VTACALGISAVTLVLTGAVERSVSPLELEVTELQPSLFLSTIERHGVIEPLQSEVVRSECYWSTSILSIVPEGTWVQEGDVVCVMDSADIEDYARSREVLLIKYRSRLDNALHDEEMLASDGERRLTAAQFRFQTADQELSEYQNGTLPRQLDEMERNLSMLSDQTRAASEELHQTERLWAMGLVNSQQMSGESLKQLALSQKQDQLQSRMNLLIDFTQPRNDVKLEHSRNDALRNVTRTEIKNALAQTKAHLTTLSYERAVRVYERYYRRAMASIEACTMRAPCDGQVMYGNSWYLKSRGITQIEEGKRIRRDQRVFEIPDRHRSKVSVPIDEALIYSVREGMDVKVIPKGYDDVEVAGKIIRVARYPRVRSRYTPDLKDYWLDVELLPTPEQREFLNLKADVEVHITLFEEPDALQVPRDAIIGVAGHNFVYVLENDELTPRSVQLGNANSDMAVVRSGVSAGDRLVTTMTKQHRAKLEETLAGDLKSTAEVSPPRG